MIENDPSSTPERPTSGQLIRVEAGAVTRDAILTLPDGAQGTVLLATIKPEEHQQALALAGIFHQQALASLVVDLFSNEELELDAQSSYFRGNTEIMQQRIIGIAEWLLQHPETMHCSVGYFGLGIVGVSALIAASERPDVVAAVVAEGTNLEAVETLNLKQITAPTLLFAAEEDKSGVQTSQQALDVLAVEKRFIPLSGSGLLFENGEPQPELMRAVGEWFQKHLTWIM